MRFSQLRIRQTAPDPRRELLRRERAWRPLPPSRANRHVVTLLSREKTLFPVRLISMSLSKQFLLVCPFDAPVFVAPAAFRTSAHARRHWLPATQLRPLPVLLR